MSYDIIGDIHGHAGALERLLTALGYADRGGAWRHPSRRAIFVGDFVDRGTRQVDTVRLVRRMVDAGSALAVMGNHEFNAIAWFLPDPDDPGEFLRPRFHRDKGPKNRDQHAAFLAEVEDTPLHREMVEWFLTLPLWLELPGLRVVHACWHDASIAFLRPRLTPDHRLTVDTMAEAARRPRHPEDQASQTPSMFEAVEIVLKGVEIPLPAGHSFLDKDGHVRHAVRVGWWGGQESTYRQAALLDDEIRLQLPELPLPDGVVPRLEASTPVFVGHYWLKGTPAPVAPTVACVDYSIAKEGRLVAYRWDGETTLDASKFAWVEAG